jgi:acyl carrier protein
MSEQEILERFSRILRDLLSRNSITLTMDTEREDVPNWDSFAFVNFIVAAELELGIKFRIADLESAKNVGHIVALAKAKLG